LRPGSDDESRRSFQHDFTGWGNGFGAAGYPR
jgi:hypothetical protein